MRSADLGQFALGSLRAYPTRSGLMMLAMAIGVASVIVLTALGEAARGYVVDQFASLGTHLVIVMPGKTETGGAGIAFGGGGSPRNLTLDDAMDLQRIPQVRRVAPLVIGAATVAAAGLERETTILGSNYELLAIRHWQLSQGQFLPAMDTHRSQPVCIIGNKIRQELFADKPALGQWLRIGEWRFRVQGVLASEGRSIGMDVEELVIIPVASAQAIFNTESLFRILLEARGKDVIEQVKTAAIARLKERHQGEEDVTVITQDAVLATFDRIFRALTYSVAGIAAISLAVAGVLVMNIMLIAVSQRFAEIGLLKAMGATHGNILRLFLAEAALLSLLGAALGLGLALLVCQLLQALYPQLPVATPAWSLFSATGVALGTAVLFAWLPARRAARMDPVQALARHG